MSKAPNNLGSIDNSRTADQRAHMLATVGQGKCPFCPDGFDPKLNRVIWVGDHWRAWHNPFPYDHHSTHITIASITHTKFSHITAEAWEEWGHVNQLLIARLNLKGGALVMRFGDLSLNAGTLAHAHSHIQVPDKTGPSMAVFYKDPTLQGYLDMRKLRHKPKT